MLGKEGKAAVAYAETVLGPEDALKYADAIRRYAVAVDREALAQREWINAGRPVELTQTNGVTGIHPLWNAMLAASDKAAKRASECRLSPASAKGPLGRQAGSTVQPDRLPTVTRLRGLK